MLERMKERVEEEESLASAYGDVVDQEDTLDNEIGLGTQKLSHVGCTQEAHEDRSIES